MEVIKAKLEFLVFENAQNHYVVASFSNLDTYHIFTAAGTIMEPVEDCDYELTGNFVKHPKYGQQFQIISAIKILPTNEKQIIRFLCSEKFAGIGRKTAQQIYDTLGENCLEMISKDISVLYQISSLNQKKIDVIQKGIEEYTGFNETYIELLKMGLSDNKIELLTKHYGNVLEVLSDNCFKPYYEINGFGYKSSVLLANQMGLEAMDTRRQDAYICNICRELSMSTGNTFLTFANIVERVDGLSIEQIQDALDRLRVDDYIRIDAQKIYPFNLYDDEVMIAKSVQDHLYEVEPLEDSILESKIHEVEFTYNIEYDDKQKEAFHAFFNHSFSILNGGPGTGKTTVVKGILRICKQLFPNDVIQLCAPTGRASKRLAQLSDCDSRTIHSLLQWDLHSNTFGKDENNKLECQFIIIDEFSMVDTHLFAQLFRALPMNCRILLIGDENQLESVGPGKVFEDLIDSKLIEVTHLEKIFRQANGSGIVSLAKEIRDESTCTFDDGVTFIEKSTSEIVPELVSLLEDCDFENSQILAPKYKGAAGIYTINSVIQELKNPPSKYKKEVKIGSTIFREDDKVMLLKNMPDDDVYNGDIGYISHIEKTKDSTIIEVDFGSNIVLFDTDFLYYLTHAYCISVHKSQGSEYDTVFMIVEPQSVYMLEKRLIYTGISRAKKQLYILGNQMLFEKQVRLKQKRLRQTSLKERLLEFKGVFL